MALIHMKNARSRRRMTIMVCAALSAVSTAAWAQVTTTTSGPVPKAPAVRTPCDGCTDSTRAQRTLLASKLDSLRSEYVRRRMTTVERETLAKEMTLTILALQELIESGMRASVADMQGDRVFIRAARSREARRSVEAGAVAMAFQSGSKRGYLGVTFDGPMLSDDGRDSVRFFRYPLIASVDPSSPAERAGVLRGDTLIALNGTDVIDHVFSFTKLLVPEEKLTMKVRREGDAKEFRVIVGEAPSYVTRRLPNPMTAMAPETPEAPEPPTALFAYPGRVLLVSSTVGGAQIEPVSQGLANNLGIKDGLLVSRVAPGSPSDRWGMREGDIILTAAGETMSSVQDFVRLVVGKYGANEGVKIVILRDQKRQDLVLK